MPRTSAGTATADRPTADKTGAAKTGAASTATEPARRGPGRPRKAAPAPAGPSEQTLPLEGYGPEVRRIDGVPVVECTPVLSNLPGDPPPPTKVNRLSLADGRTLYGCSECDHVGPTNGSVRGHRVAEHGVRQAGFTRERREAKRTGTAPTLPDTIAGLTLGELLETAATHERLANLFELQEIQLTEWKARAIDAEKKLARIETQVRAQIRQLGLNVVEED